MKPAHVYIGTSGWYYDHWEGVLYPPGLAKTERFNLYSQNFNAVEINATFYRLPSKSMVSGWQAKAPNGFKFVSKVHRAVTHHAKLKNAQNALSRFFKAMSPLNQSLGAFLYQLPPSLERDVPLLQDFLDLLPAEPKSCFEFRHASWENDNIYAVLAQTGAGHVIVSKKDYPFVETHTGGIAYYRLHGPEQMCASSYGNDWMSNLADRLRKLSRDGITSFTFFNNDIGGHAVNNARFLCALLSDVL